MVVEFNASWQSSEVFDCRVMEGKKITDSRSTLYKGEFPDKFATGAVRENSVFKFIPNPNFAHPRIKHCRNL